MKPLYRKVLLCTCLVLFLVAPAPLDAQETTFTHDDDGFMERIGQHYAVKPDGSLTLDAEIGSVRVDSWTNDEVEIRIEKRVEGRREDRARSAFEEIEVILSQRENDVRIQVVDNGSGYFFRGRVAVQVTIRVPERHSLDLSTVDGSIEIDNMKGPVTVSAVDGDIKIGTAEGGIDAGTADGNIEIEDVKGSVTARAVDGDIDVRRVTGEVNATTMDGDIEIRSTRGTVTANTMDGDIDVWRVTGEVNAGTVDGDINIRRVTGEVGATTTDGDIEIRNTLSAVTASTVDGNIETNTTDGEVDAGALEGNIHLFDARGSVKAQAARGSIEVYVAGSSLDPPDAEPGLDANWDLETTEGDVTIHLPGDLTASIEAEGSSGGLLLSRLWRADLGQINSDFSLNQSEWGVFLYVQSEASGDINGGGDRIRLKTNSGNIYIRERHR